MQRRARYVWVCTNRRPEDHPRGSCAASGSEALRDALKSACKRAGLDPLVRVNSSGCLDLCEHGITVAVMPDDVVLGRVTLEDVPALVEGLRSPGGVLAQPSLAGKVLPGRSSEPADTVPLGLRKPAP